MTPLLARHFTVYAMDRRVRGASGDAPDYSLEREFADVAVVVVEIGQGRAPIAARFEASRQPAAR